IGCATSRACPCGCHSRTPLLHLLTCTKDMLAWVKKRRRTIRREDLISFLCGKAPPHRSSRANPRLTVVAPSRANSPAETGSSVEADLQPFREAIALHGKNTAPEWTHLQPASLGKQPRSTGRQPVVVAISCL
ncbi:unnamed protein product, partial [Tetraodon nigroviridis]